MTDPKVTVFLDEDVNTLIAEMLWAAGVQAKTVSGLRRKGLSDDLQLEFAVDNGYLFVTHNRVDYENLAVEYFESGKTHYGIAISSFKPPRIIANKIIEITECFSRYELLNQIFYI